MIDSTRAGSRVRDHVPGLDSDVPVVESIDQALALRPDVLLIGIAPAGGRLPDAWRRSILRAIEAGLDVESGLHDFLADDPELAAAAQQHGVEIRDLRRPPAGLDVPSGANLRVDGFIVSDGRIRLRAGQDDGLPRARRRGAAARHRQRLRSHRPDRDRDRGLGDRGGRGGVRLRGRRDRAAGARGRRARPGRARCCGSRARARSAIPPTRASRSGCCTARRAHAMVLVHEPGRTHLDMPDGPPIPPLPQLIDDYQRMARYVRSADVVAVSLKTNRLSEAGRAGRDRRRRERRPACPPTIPSASGPASSSTRCCAESDANSAVVADPRLDSAGLDALRLLARGRSQAISCWSPARPARRSSSRRRWAEITRLGGQPWCARRCRRVDAALLEDGSDSQLTTVTEIDRLDAETPDKTLTIWADTNTRYMSGVAPDRQAVWSRGEAGAHRSLLRAAGGRRDRLVRRDAADPGPRPGGGDVARRLREVRVQRRPRSTTPTRWRSGASSRPARRLRSSARRRGSCGSWPRTPT